MQSNLFHIVEPINESEWKLTVTDSPTFTYGYWDASGFHQFLCDSSTHKVIQHWHNGIESPINE